jgi:hypothetical protein
MAERPDPHIAEYLASDTYRKFKKREAQIAEKHQARERSSGHLRRTFQPPLHSLSGSPSPARASWIINFVTTSPGARRGKTPRNAC